MIQTTIKKWLFTTLLFIGVSFSSTAITTPPKYANALADTLYHTSLQYAKIGKVTIKDITIDKHRKRISIYTNNELSYLPLRPNIVDELYRKTKLFLQTMYPQYAFIIISDKKELRSQIPALYRKNKTGKRFQRKTSFPLVSNISTPFRITQGLIGRHIALWNSHGRYYNQKLQRWNWQRPGLFQTTEDMLSTSFILPYVVPMLENAGANVLLPRERDTQTNEIIIDNEFNTNWRDFQRYNGTKKWQIVHHNGFANIDSIYTDNTNPFKQGSFLKITTTTDQQKVSTATWSPTIPEDGEYAVYVAYQSFRNSCPNTLYTVFHDGGETQFEVNQRMGGGTWIFLGKFYFSKGNHTAKVTLSNIGYNDQEVVTADAVKIGGGMGNIARKPADKITRIRIKSKRGRRGKRYKTVVTKYNNPTVSGYPRYAEGARYWLQWAGVPDSVYSRTKGKNDYSDDFQSRGFWVNYLSGGSVVRPYKQGLNIPIDLALALHTDAGVNRNDSIIGTLGIYTLYNNDKPKKYTYGNGISRVNGREMSDFIQSQIVDDIKKVHQKDWTRRGLWNKSYSESRVPEIPTILIELLSHQNFADMKYALDPRFRFTVGRAIYKAVVKYIALANQTQYTIEPLPVSHFAMKWADENSIILQWQPSKDSLETSATPTAYMVYTRINGGGFDNGQLVKTTKITLPLAKDTIYSFKVEAVNAGGRSFPSEILSACKTSNSKGDVLIINGFDRISAPHSFSVTPNYAGFNNLVDAGIPYIYDLSYVGTQFDFDRNSTYVNDKKAGWGNSHKEAPIRPVAGNSFDYPYVHGCAIKEAQFSFLSCSNEAIEAGHISMKDYPIADIILGKQRKTSTLSNEKGKMEFACFSPKMQKSIEEYTAIGGSLIISGNHIASDILADKNSSAQEKDFIHKTLKTDYINDRINGIDEVNFKSLPQQGFSPLSVNFYAHPNDISYFVEQPEIITPYIDSGAFTLCTYSISKESAGVAYKKNYGLCLFGFPIEAVRNDTKRAKIIRMSLNFLSSKKRTQTTIIKNNENE